MIKKDLQKINLSNHVLLFLAKVNIANIPRSKIYVNNRTDKCDIHHTYDYFVYFYTLKFLIMHQCILCTDKCSAVNSLQPGHFEPIENNIVRVNFEKGENIFKEGTLSLNVAFLKSGIVKLHMHGPVREKILRIVKAPSYLGIPTTFGDKINQFSATAIVETSICFIDVNLFRSFIYNNGKFAYDIIVELCENEIMDYQRYTNQSQKQIIGMVAETLLCMSDKIFDSPRFKFPLTQSELADLVGTSRESISRILSDFSANKIIAFNGKELNILKRDVLEHISEKG